MVLVAFGALHTARGSGFAGGQQDDMRPAVDSWRPRPGKEHAGALHGDLLGAAKEAPLLSRTSNVCPDFHTPKHTTLSWVPRTPEEVDPFSPKVKRHFGQRLQIGQHFLAWGGQGCPAVDDTRRVQAVWEVCAPIVGAFAARLAAAEHCYVAYSLCRLGDDGKEDCDRPHEKFFVDLNPSHFYQPDGESGKWGNMRYKNTTRPGSSNNNFITRAWRAIRYSGEDVANETGTVCDIDPASSWIIHCQDEEHWNLAMSHSVHELQGLGTPHITTPPYHYDGGVVDPRIQLGGNTGYRARILQGNLQDDNQLIEGLDSTNFYCFVLGFATQHPNAYHVLSLDCQTFSAEMWNAAHSGKPEIDRYQGFDSTCSCIARIATQQGMMACRDSQTWDPDQPGEEMELVCKIQPGPQAPPSPPSEREHEEDEMDDLLLSVDALEHDLDTLTHYTGH